LLYRSAAQSERWLELARRWAPFVNSPECRELYRCASETFAREIDSDLALVALGCGDGGKDRQVLEALQTSAQAVRFVPLDVSYDLVRRAAEQARGIVPDQGIHPIVADVGRSKGLKNWLDTTLGDEWTRGFTFFGMVPNLEPSVVVETLDRLVRGNDLLLLSANLVSDESDAAIQEILPQYDNQETRAWLLGFLRESGLAEDDYDFSFRIVGDPEWPRLRRVEASAVFPREARAEVLGESMVFPAGFTLRVFFSYRYTKEQLEGLLSPIGLRVVRSWLAGNQEEGVFLCRRTA
jgi:uncharacterized SAM-dependent methyltransferase